MKAIYIRPTTELVKVELKKDISESWDTWATKSQWQNSGNANENFFSEEDDDADPFFDD